MRRISILVIVIMALPARALADVAPDSMPADAPARTTAPTERHLVGDIRWMTLWRSNDNYFQHALAFHYDMPYASEGLSLSAGVEIVPRLSVLAGGHYLFSGDNRSGAYLRLLSGGVYGMVRYAALRFSTEEDKVIVDLAPFVGFGRYVIRETYINTALSSDSFKKDDGSFGGQAGIEASAAVYGIRVVLGYAYHYAPAGVSDRIGGVAYAGGNELSLGVGVRL